MCGFSKSFVKGSVTKGGKNDTKGWAFKVSNWKEIHSFECLGAGKMDKKSLESLYGAVCRGLVT